MSFSLALVASLMMLYPGFCALGGFYTGSRVDNLSPAPEKPNSLQNLTIIVTGALAAHLFGAGSMALMEGWCSFRPCWTVNHQPNPYVALLTGYRDGTPNGVTIVGLLLGIAALGLAMFYLANWLATKEWIRSLAAPAGSKWFRDMVRDAADDRKVVTGYVVSKMNEKGSYVAYEGMVLHLAQDENQAITNIALRSVDRFIVKIDDDGFSRVQGESDTIETLMIRADETTNIAFSIFELPDDSE